MKRNQFFLWILNKINYPEGQILTLPLRILRTLLFPWKSFKSYMINDRFLLDMNAYKIEDVFISSLLIKTLRENDILKVEKCDIEKCKLKITK